MLGEEIMQRDKFTDKLHFELSEEAEHPFDIYGDILSKIFYDVKEYKDKFNIETINVKKQFFGNYDTLGEYFQQKPWHGIFNTWPDHIITDAGFCVYLYDDKFEVRDIEDYDEKYISLMEPKYQKRYVAEMYKIFGEPYKKHYQEIIQEKRNALEKEAGFIQ